MAVDVRLFHESGCRLVHKYRVYRDPFPHPALRGRVMNKLLALVARAMVIAQLTQLHITIPGSGSGMAAVPEECFPPVSLPRVLALPRRAYFASEVTVLGTTPGSSAIRELTSMDVSTAVSKLDCPLLPAPPGFDQFVWPEAPQGPGGMPATFDFSVNLPGWFRQGLPGATGDLPSLPVSPILSDSSEVSVVGVSGAPPPPPPMGSDPPSRTNGMLDQSGKLQVRFRNRSGK